MEGFLSGFTEGDVVIVQAQSVRSDGLSYIRSTKLNSCWTFAVTRWSGDICIHSSERERSVTCMCQFRGALAGLSACHARRESRKH